jgi:hypothetical protein
MFISQLEIIARVTRYGRQMGLHYILLSTILNAQFLRVRRLSLQMLALDAVYMIKRVILLRLFLIVKY